MATRAIRPKRDDSMLAEWQSIPDAAPSAMRKDSPVAAQILLFVGFFLSLVGILALVAPLVSWSYFIGPGAGFVALTLGYALMLYHCFVDSEPQFRFLYTLGSALLIAGGVVCHLMALSDPERALGLNALSIGLLAGGFGFAFGTARHEINANGGSLARMILLGTGAALLVYAIVRGHFGVDFLTTSGVLLMILGVIYVISYLGLCGDRDDSLASGAAFVLTGILVFNLGLALLRSFLDETYLVPAGLVQGAISLLGLGMLALLRSDRSSIVLARRELTSYFCSPVAYLVIFGAMIMFGINFLYFIRGFRGPMPEPITIEYVLGWLPIIVNMALIPLITMRSYSEEKRTGSLELLLTAPVDETMVVLGKFFASLAFYMIAWLPFFLFMVSLRIFGGSEYDYRPLLSFALALLATGAGYLAMGGFFSSLTSNQIVAAVLMFAMMIGQVLLWSLPMLMPGPWSELARDMSFVKLWLETGQGYLPIKLFAYHISVAIFFVAATVVVLNSRRWK